MLSNNNHSTSQLRANFLLVVMAAIVCFLPIFKGGNYPGAMPIFIFVMGLIFLLSFSEISYKRDKRWLIVWFAFSCAVLLHAFLYPLFFVNERFFIDGLSSEVGAELNSLQLSSIRMIEVWSFFTAMFLFAWRVSLFQLSQIRVLLLALFIASLFQALFGVFHFISGATNILGLWTKEYYLGDATGTFVNRNHFSGMLAVSSPVVLSGLLMPKPLIMPSLSQGYRIAVSIFYLAVLILALISSHSRMGMAAGIFGLVVCYYWVGRARKQVQEKPNRSNFLYVIVFVSLFAIWFGLGDILQRYTDLGDGNSRFDVWKSMFLKVPFDVWIFGAGPGSFESVFQIIKPSNFSLRFIYAHNDYLEFVFEFGLVLSFFILSTVFLWVKHFRSNLMKGSYLNAGIFGSFAAIGLHSLVDFNLQVPASALCFWFVVGLMANPVVFEDSAVSGVDLKAKMQRKGLNNRTNFPKTKREWLDFFRSD